jgi:hypothetical protein
MLYFMLKYFAELRPVVGVFTNHLCESNGGSLNHLTAT